MSRVLGRIEKKVGVRFRRYRVDPKEVDRGRLIRYNGEVLGFGLRTGKHAYSVNWAQLLRWVKPR